MKIYWFPRDLLLYSQWFPYVYFAVTEPEPRQMLFSDKVQNYGLIKLNMVNGIELLVHQTRI